MLARTIGTENKMGRSVMAKTFATTEEIKAELDRTIEASPILRGFYSKLCLSMPRQAYPADRGANWHVDNMQPSVATEEGAIPESVMAEISRIVGSVQSEYDCSDW